MNSAELCTLYLIRHGQTDWNVRHLIQGQTDISLNLEGQTSARELAQEFKDIKFDRVYSSDLLRAKETAEIIALEHKLAVETTRALRERYFGEFQGKTPDHLQELNDTLASLTDEERYSYTHNGMVESDKDIMDRFITFIREIAVANLGKTILVATHSGVIRAFLTKLGKLEYENPKEGPAIRNLAYVKLESDGVDFFVRETSGIEKRDPVL
jgi:probable phosphoglycerate mutase